MIEALAFAAAALAVAAFFDLAAMRGPRQPRRLLLLRALALAGGRLRRGRGAPVDLAARISAAGHPGGLGVRELMAAKVGAALAGGALASLLAAAAPGRLGLLLAVAGPAGCFLAPDLWLHRRAGQRARRARRELPALLDLLRVSIEAGQSPVAALRAVGSRSSGPAGTEWRALVAAVDLGVPFADAAARMPERLPLPEVEAFATLLARSGRHGTALAEPIAAMARELRLAERRRIREEAARAGPKIQLVVALLLVPSVLLMVAAALAGALMGPGTAASLD